MYTCFAIKERHEPNRVTPLALRCHHLILLSALWLGVIDGAGRADASCGQAFCPVESAAITERPTGAKELTLDASWEYIDQDQPRVGTHSTGVGHLPSPEHDEVETVNRTYKLIGQYGVTDRFALGLVLPIVHRNHRHIVREERELESWDFSGVGDMQAWARYSLIVPRAPSDRSLGIGLGVKLPTGGTGMKNGEGEPAEITLQPGTGSTDVLTHLIFTQPLNLPAPGGRRAWAPVFTSATARFTGTDGRFGYRAGTEVLMNLGMAYPLFQRVHLLGQLNWRYRDRDDAGDAEGVPEANTGGEALFLSPGVRIRVIDELWVYGLVQIPLYQRVNGIQLTANWNLLLGATFRFSVEGFFRTVDET